jgi:hypothetical protein
MRSGSRVGPTCRVVESMKVNLDLGMIRIHPDTPNLGGSDRRISYPRCCRKPVGVPAGNPTWPFRVILNNREIVSVKDYNVRRAVGALEDVGLVSIELGPRGGGDGHGELDRACKAAEADAPAPSPSSTTTNARSNACHWGSYERIRR